MADIMKRKRTKRPRHPSPLALAMASTSSNITETATARVGATVRTSPSTSADEFTDSTEEEEDMADMANCLILLAQSRVQKSPQPTTSPSNSSAAGTAVSGGGRLYVYQCKTCDRCFSSFQALGGHRASHNKPKSGVNGEEKKLFAVSLMREDADRFSHENSTALSLQILPNRGISANKSKIHECGICGAEFSSGQALGGHMRRHRQIPAVAAATNSDDLSQEVKKSRTVLALDLNLPAPEDDHRESKFGFASKELIVFSASSLVDCHY